MSGIELISKERQEQLEKHNYSVESDTKYMCGELVSLAEYILKEDNDAEKDELVSYLTTDLDDGGCGFKMEFLQKINAKPKIEQLAIAGALIAAEIDNLQNN
jgi:hypothetical protein